METTAMSIPASAGRTERFEDRFVAYIQGVCRDNGSRAALRRAVRRRPEEALTAHRFLAAWTGDIDPYREAVLYQVAAWIAQYDRAAKGRPLPLGRALAATTHGLPGRSSIAMQTVETRLMSASRAGADALLYVQIPQMLNLIFNTGNAIAWASLFRDLMRWPYASGEVAKRWMTDYYRAQAHTETATAVPVPDTDAQPVFQS